MRRDPDRRRQDARSGHDLQGRGHPVGRPRAVLAHVKELLQQAADKLRAICPEVKFGVYSAGLKRRDTEHPVIVAGIQSVYKRACELDAFDLIIVDEAHLIRPGGEGMYRQFLAEAKVVNPRVRTIGLTATPFRLKSGMICGPDNILNAVCYEIGVKELIRDGYLCPLVTKAGRRKGRHRRVCTSAAASSSPTRSRSSWTATSWSSRPARRSSTTPATATPCLIFASGVKHAQHIQARAPGEARLGVRVRLWQNAGRRA